MIFISAAEFEVNPIKQIPQSKNHEFVSCGIGSITALENSLKMKSKLVNKDIFFVGTCGIFGAFNEISLITSNEVYWLPSDQRTGNAWSIENQIPSLHLKSHKTLQLPIKKVITSPLISKNPYFDHSTKSIFKNSNDVVENLELYCFLKNIYSVAKSIQIILAITNEISINARKEWKQNYEEAAEKTKKYIIDNQLL